ncbi:uncharacterized protein LOC111009011 isoform X2 [Momordica charantia]|uniref:Uncharacterized protein LOC111009011 isoform X2 n=1 Tax=Momordica charantia TaxID=3673 RepID=A0A6J1C749_MOMCH|nr:uncharacterized protein LOC111009011 isoform X2 [Momordica charantia]
MATALAALQFAFVSPATSKKFAYPFFSSSGRRNGVQFVHCANASISRNGRGAFDPELRSVLELATNSELYELEQILFGPSYFSPLMKSITNRGQTDYAMIEEDLEERDDFISMLESRFLFLAADARSTLRGWRPSYRDVLLTVRKKLNVPCSTKLSSEDLEAEIFLHLLQEYSSEESVRQSNLEGSLQLGLDRWKVQTLAATDGASDLRSLILKGGSLITAVRMFQMFARTLSGKVFKEAANYQIKKEIIKKGGQLAAANLESRVALLVAQKGLAGAASRYLGFRSVMTLLGPMFWGTFLADIVIQMMGTDYARILRAIYAFAQIRITRTYRLSSSASDEKRV